MAHLQTTCPNCKKTFRAAPDALGKKTRCKKCAALFLITVGVGSPVDSDPDPFSIDFPGHVPKSPPAATSTVTTSKPQAGKPAAPAKTSETTQGPIPPGSHPVAPPAIANSAAKVPLSPYEAFAQQVSGNTSADENSYLAINRKLHHQGKNAQAGNRSSEGLVFRGTGMMLFGLFLFGLAFSGMHIQNLNLVSPIGALIGVGIGALGAILLISGLHQRFFSTLLLGVIPLVLFLGGGGLVAYLFTTGYWSDGGAGYDLAGNQQPGAFGPMDRNGIAINRWANPIEQPQKLEPRPAEVIPGGGGRRNNAEAAPPVQPQPVEQPRPVQPQPVEQRPPVKQQPAEVLPPVNPPFVDNIRTAEGRAAAMAMDASSPPPWDDAERRRSMSRRTISMSRHLARNGRSTSSRSISTDWLTDSVGKMTNRFDRYFANTDNLPVVGVDATASFHGGGFDHVMPVYDSTDDTVSIAKPGFALGGLNVYYRNGEVHGFQCVYMKYEQERLDGNEIYFGNWIGNKPGNPDQIKTIDSDGQTVVGVYFEGVPAITAIGLIRKPR